MESVCRLGRARTTLPSVDTPITEYELNAALREASNAGTPDAVVEELLEAAQHPDRLDGVTPAAALIAASETLARFERHDEAVDVARRAVEAGSDEVLTPRAWLASTLVDAGRYEEGLAEFRRGRRDDPDDWTMYQLAGETFESAGDLRQAVAWFTAGGQRAGEKEERSAAYLLLGGRRRVRQAMGFPEDDQDRWVVGLRDRMFAEDEESPLEGGRAGAQPPSGAGGRGVTGRGGTREWPPARNEPCWCGSGTKYKKCCGAPSAAERAGS